MCLDLRTLREINSARASRWDGGKPAPLAFNLMELAGEAGEACNAGKKLARHEYGFAGGDPDVSKLAEELADTVICADLAANKAGIDLADAVAKKFNKTSVKYGFPERLEARPVVKLMTPENPNAPEKKRPGIVAISGSTRFIDTMAIEAWKREVNGEIALGCHLLPSSFCDVDHHFAEKHDCAEAMDELHLRKIDMADRLFVCNVGGYIGASTRREIEYATKLGKPVSYLEPVDAHSPTQSEVSAARVG